MYEKVNKHHPDKVADRIAGAIVDYAYANAEDPKIAVEILTGHGTTLVITETSIKIPKTEIEKIVSRIAGPSNVIYVENAQDEHLAENQKDKVRCGDNGIFKGVPTSDEEKLLGRYARLMDDLYASDGKYIINGNNITVCQSNAENELLGKITKAFKEELEPYINPLGEWTGGTNVDCGATNRKLGSDMGRAATGGGLHGKDLTKADVSINIYAHLLAELHRTEVNAVCSIGDERVKFYYGIEVEEDDFADIVNAVKTYIKDIGGFESFAEYGLI